MSYDLHVYSRRHPKAADLDSFRAAEPLVTADGRLKRDGYILLADAADTHVEVDGPGRAEAEDLPEPFRTDGSGLVFTIAGSDRGFETAGCGTWTKIG